ncbi:MAG: dihydroorotase [Pelagibacterales bacterium MED-G40]|nr:MAG: dihydroorotase [Candidatus Pelagibacter sp. TMED203]PDH19537.1 MAG: dihydroorotase [Pelagibacterales bacterium MED-G40]|tara:strand:- start:6082 stop:7374 length:1293 start_codon:yes stop_codon:yes gene_type:complete
MKEKILINARIVDPSQKLDCIGGLIIDSNGKIKAIGKNINKNIASKNAEIIDIKKNILIPGIVDMKTFVGEPGYEYKENFRTLSQAALSGGVTSVVSMPNTKPVIDNVSMVDFIMRRGRDKAKINIYPCAALTRNIDGNSMTEFGLLSSRGIIGFTDVIRTIQNTSIMARVMNYASDMGVLIMQHAQDYELSKDGLVNEGEISTRLGLSGIPTIAEKIIIERDLSLLEEYPCRYHINQISAMKSLEVIKKNKLSGKKFTVGVSINNLSLNENDIGDFKTFLKLSPPLRSEKDRVALINGIKEDLIDVIVSDHKPEDEESKRLPFSQAATGAIGVETLLPLALELYHNESLELSKIIQSLTINPSKILNIKKGSLKKGFDADICIFDLNKPWVIKSEELKSKSKNTAIEDRKLQGKVLMTFLNGELVFNQQ